MEIFMDKRYKNICIKSFVKKGIIIVLVTTMTVKTLHSNFIENILNILLLQELPYLLQYEYILPDEDKVNCFSERDLIKDIQNIFFNDLILLNNIDYDDYEPHLLDQHQTILNEQKKCSIQKINICKFGQNMDCFEFLVEYSHI